jgi:hypothetical protein
MTITVEIQAGICGFRSTVEAALRDRLVGSSSEQPLIEEFQVSVRIVSECPRVQAMAAKITSLDPVGEVLRKPLIETTPALQAAEHRLQATCPVPVGVLKAIEAGANLALPASCEIKVSRAEP